MFGKEQPDVITDEEVGNYIAKLKSETDNPLKYIGVNEDGLVGDSREPTTTETR